MSQGQGNMEECVYYNKKNDKHWVMALQVRVVDIFLSSVLQYCTVYATRYSTQLCPP